MTHLRLFARFCLFAFSLTGFAASTWAAQASEGKPAVQTDPVVYHKPEKLAGRASNVSDANGAMNKTPGAQYPGTGQEVHEKKPMSKEERRALRRQINETEAMYPKRK